MGSVTISFLVMHGLGYKDGTSPPSSSSGYCVSSISISSSSSEGDISSFEVFKRLIRGFPDFFVLGFLFYGFSVPVIMLCGLHIKLISLHKTTNEEIK